MTTQPDGNVIKVGKVMTLIGGRQSELVLENVKREDLGAFTCLAKNSLGEASALLILPGDFLCTSSSIVCTWGNVSPLLLWGTKEVLQKAEGAVYIPIAGEAGSCTAPVGLTCITLKVLLHTEYRVIFGKPYPLFSSEQKTSVSQ